MVLSIRASNQADGDGSRRLSAGDLPPACKHTHDYDLTAAEKLGRKERESYKRNAVRRPAGNG